MHSYGASDCKSSVARRKIDMFPRKCYGLDHSDCSGSYGPVQAQLPLLLSLIQEVQKSEERELTIHYILSELSTPQQMAFSQVLVTMKLLLVMPAMNACSERSFSAFQMLKPHLRATVSQQRLNNLLVLHVHKNKTDLLKLAEVGNVLGSKGFACLENSSRLFFLVYNY